MAIKKLAAFLLLFAVAFNGGAQDSIGIVHDWKVVSKKLDAGKYELEFTGTAAAGWQVYAPNQLILEQKTTELRFADSSISQEGDFALPVSPVTVKSSIFETNVGIYEGKLQWKAIIRIAGDVPARLEGELFYSYGKNDEYNPSTKFEFAVPLEGGVTAAETLRIATININKPVSDCGDEGTKNKSLLTIFLLGLLGGLIALLTPCVFPMVPVTVTFFTKKSTDRKKGIANAILYGLFIFLIYILITLPFHIAGKAISPEIFNNISTNVWLNLLFFAVFVVFALSFFGLFEIGLPAGFANKMDSKSGLGNISGIFFMATTLAIVSFSCTGPILGTLLVGVADQGAWPLTAGAAGFGIALGLPFALFAMFPHWLQSLPRSGGWMTDVKVVLGFVELALAVKFLSNADLVMQWGFLKREIFIGLWVIIGVMVVLYLTGVWRIAHSSPVKKYSLVRLVFIALFGAFTLYIIPGLSNTRWADLKLISGFPPPMSYSLYDRKNEFNFMHNDYQGAIRKARAEHKPVLIDFTGWACVNCRRMEEKAWPDAEVKRLMEQEFVVVSLYVDEKLKLPVKEQRVEQLPNGTEKSIRTVGDKWSTFQALNFEAASQPQYAIISPEEIALTKTKFYTPDPREFAKWLKCGLDAYKKTARP